MDDRSLGTLRMILHAAARVLGCGSAQMAIVDEERRALVLRVAIANRDVPQLERVSSLLGFAPDGAKMPLAGESNALLVRAVREGRLFVSARFDELVGDFLSAELSAGIQSVIGVQSFAVVPVFGRSSTVGVILFQKLGDSGFAPTDRDLMVAYADRVGAELESQAITHEVAALESLGDVGSPPPAIYPCDGALVLLGGDAAGRPLLDVLGAPSGSALLGEAAARPGDGARTVTLAASDGRSLRVTLRPSPGGVIAVVEDIGWLERLAREAARAREHLARVLSTVGDAIFTVDTHGTIVGCNEAVRGAFGRAPAELLGRPLTELYSDERMAARASRLTLKVADDGFAEAELTFRRADGRLLPTAVSALLLVDDQEHPAGSLWRLQDLTERRRGDAERKRLRAKLLQSERLSALGEMAARIAHEVRNPLVSIGAAARVVEEELPPSSPVLEEVRAIGREVRRLDGIVSDFLRFARPRQIVRAPVDLGALVRETVALVGARGAGVRLIAPVGSGETITRGDADSLRQVLWNVLLNAVEASPPGGEVECAVRALRGRVVVSVADQGAGIPDAIRRRVFDPFFSTKARGTGLGLAVSRQIVDEHGGRLRLLNRQGGGTRVVIELPG
ncbi:MAG: PAS domain-containing protein [Myxococcales bacterium]|nr:PAS domain-containing protein [Myxococcales bacterium]